MNIETKSSEQLAQLMQGAQVEREMTPEEIHSLVHSVQVSWRHPMEIHGVPVPASRENASHTLWMLNSMKLPENMQGQEVLDVGCSDGMFSFLSEQRGAKRVVGMDRWWGGGPGGVTVSNYDKENKELREEVTSAPFFIAHRLLKSKVEFYQGDIQRIDLTPQVANSKFDTIFFLGVLYHLENPLGALKNLRSICRERMFLESTVLRDKTTKAMQYLGLAHDIQWRPTEACLMEMLKNCGFREVRHLGDEQDRAMYEVRV